VTQPVEYMSVGERIAIYRRRRGLSQLALANMIGRSEAWLSQVERGIRHVDRVSVLIRLAQVLKVTVEDLIGQPLSLAPNGGIEFRAIPALRAALTDYELIPATFGVATGDGPTRDLPSLPGSPPSAPSQPASGRSGRCCWRPAPITLGTSSSGLVRSRRPPASR
jgi:transcriptional regulator with XRE-family HTH domain